MKLIILLFVSLLFAANCFTNSRFCEAAEPPAVRDSTGKLVRATTYYFIQPVHREVDGWGFQLGRTGGMDKRCPLGIVGQDYYNGTAVQFLPVNSKKGIIRLYTDLNIDFNTYTVCDGWNTVWKIEEFSNNYKIRYCPSVCGDCKVTCKDVGIVEYNGQKRLALSDIPVQVKFVKLVSVIIMQD
ncbi:kunitz trypsin inhibitor 5-like [Lycium ferocissimum]|uniref:kunitz trypsin inhibitor 5-like n=1 Tax=Lycium ferocissimum TaxID=112874 RepID=UPI0028152D85|nr:kunitz trypsin inhibitor 5-like [Lycium ferocissimum]